MINEVMRLCEARLYVCVCVWGGGTNRKGPARVRHDSALIKAVAVQVRHAELLGLLRLVEAEDANRT